MTKDNLSVACSGMLQYESEFSADSCTHLYSQNKQVVKDNLFFVWISTEVDRETEKTEYFDKMSN